MRRLSIRRDLFATDTVDEAVKRICAIDGAYSVLRAMALSQRDRGNAATARMAADATRDLVAAFAEPRPFGAGAKGA